MAGPSTELAPVIAASTQWLARAYPPAGPGSVAHTQVELQARDAVTVAALLRYPTELDAELVAIAGPGGSAVLDWRAGYEPGGSAAGDLSAGFSSAGDPSAGFSSAGVPWAGDSPAGFSSAGVPWAGDDGWRTWVDEVVVSWAACLLADPLLALRAVKAVAAVAPPDNRPRPRRPPPPDSLGAFPRLIAPDPADRAAAVLLRHPDLLEPIAALHRDTLLYLLPE